MAVALLCACGGGGGALPGNGSPTSAPRAAQAVVNFTLLVPRAAQSAVRRPEYVSSRTQSAGIAVNGGAAVVANITPGSPNCTTGAQGLSCTVSAQAPVGNDTIRVQLYGQTNAQGPVLAQGTTSATVAGGIANTVTLTLNGIVAKIVLALASAAPPQGTAATIPLTVTLYDAAGAAIVGDPFVNPVTLTDSDTSGATALSRTAIASPADAAKLSVAYSGAALTSATFGATANGVAAANVTPATLTPAAGATKPFLDWTTYAFDNHRDGFNPSSTALTPSSLAALHLAWQQLGYNNDYNTSTQPVLAANVGTHARLLFTGGSLGILYAWDALTGTLVWQRPLGNEQYTCASGASSQIGIGGTVAYDPASRSIYVADNVNAAPNATATSSLVRLDAAQGTLLGSINITPSLLAGELDVSHTAVTLANGYALAGTSSPCDLSSWRGRVAAVNPNMTGAPNMFYTTYGVGGNFSGGGVWAWGGVSVDDAGAVYAGVGNTDNSAGASGPQPPFVQTASEEAGYGDHIVQLSPNVSSLIDADDPGYVFGGSSDDLDLAGVPVLFKPIGCSDTLAAVQGKAGELLVYDTQSLHAGPVKRFRVSPSTGEAGDIANPAWSPSTGLLYVVVSSGTGGSIDPPGMIALKPSGCGFSTGLTVAWHTAFGPDSYNGAGGTQPRSAPTVTAGGVVLTGSPCTPDGSGGCLPTIGATFGGALWALDASTGALLNGGKPLLTTGDHIRMPAVVDGQWVYVQDNNANLYGLTLDPSVKAIAAGHRTPQRHPSWFRLTRRSR